MSIEAMKRMVEGFERLALFKLQPDTIQNLTDNYISIGRQAIAEAEKQEPVAWKIVPIKPTEEMLKAMDECSKEGYDERLYAGHAASVYMAAVDVAPSPKVEQEPVAWRDHVEQRLLTWRQSFVNKSGDQLALDDFMDKRSLDDLIDFVCDEYSAPPQRQPLTDEQIAHATAPVFMGGNPSLTGIVRAIEAAHGIKGEA